jgi:hypothetical protein
MRVWALRRLRSQHLGALLAASYAGLFSVALDAGPGRKAALCLIGVAALASLAWAAALRRARAVAELPTSRIASAAQGYAEIMGRAKTDPSHLVVSPLSGVPCLWYRYHLYSKDNSKNEWREVDSDVSSATFELLDATGACNIDPDHAEVMGAEVRTSYPGGDEKLVEELLFAGRDIFVLGEFSTLGGANSTLSVRDDVSALLASWKEDRAGLKRRFDLDGNGEIDLTEWALAQQQATQAVEQQHRDLRQAPGVHMMRAPADGRLFLISALAPQKLRRRFLLWSFFHLTVGLLAVGGLIRLG